MSIDKKQRFLNKANVVHDNKYDYSLVDYINPHTKVRIVCIIHGVFEQTPTVHLRCGCPMCAQIQRKQTNLERYGGQPLRSNAIQEKRKQTCLDKYGVTHPLYLDSVKNKVLDTKRLKYGTVGSESHMKIQQKRVNTMLEKYGVEYATQSSVVREKTKQTNLERYGVEYHQQSHIGQNKIKQTWLTNHGVDHPWKLQHIRNKCKQTMFEKYGVEFTGQSTDLLEKIKNTNLEKRGVLYVKQEHMINVLSLIENRDWLFDQYIIQNKTATQISDELDISDTTIGRYLRQHEIAIKYSYQHSVKQIQWLEYLMEREGINIQHALNGGEYQIPGTRYKADGYCQETNTIYEFHGDYWHGNPEIYEDHIINEVIGKSMGELYQKTCMRDDEIRELGYNLIVMWENNFNNV